jgi:hypothetical protein|tara:strand:- start:783 stop:1046 length:264 start_codon:yes stop_codon:yes gene_type:complete
MSQKRRKTLSMANVPPTQMLTLNKPNVRGAQVNEAIKEIIFNLEKYDRKNQDLDKEVPKDFHNSMITRQKETSAPREVNRIKTRNLE